MSILNPRKKEGAYHHGNLKNALVETALRMVEEEGSEAITIRELTHRLGTSRSAVYRHFSGKTALIQAVIEAGFARFDAAIAPFLQNDTLPFLDRLRATGIAYVEFAMNNPPLYRLLFGKTHREEREAFCDLQDEMQSAGFHALAQFLQEGQQNGTFKQGDPQIQAMLIWSAMHGFAMLLIDGHIAVKDRMDTLYEAIYQTLLEGLKRKKESDDAH